MKNSHHSNNAKTFSLRSSDNAKKFKRQVKNKPYVNQIVSTDRRTNRRTDNQSRVCLLCGKNGHSSPYCWAMKDERGNKITVSPSQKPCEYCKTKKKVDLYHPIRVCFNKKRDTRSNKD